MAKVTSKLQLTVPKSIADQYGIRPGDELDWIAAGDSIRVIPPKKMQNSGPALTVAERLQLFDEATERQQRRAEALKRKLGGFGKSTNRGWTREELYGRGGSD